MGDAKLPGHSYSLTEVFRSVQSEGYWAGTPAIFVRFSGCNLACEWCDTDHAMRFEANAEGLLKLIEQSIAGKAIHHIVLTGGEPMVQLAIHPGLVQLLQGRGFYVSVETNGTIPLPRTRTDGRKWIDWVTVSPKARSRIEVTTADEVKVVWQPGWPEPWDLETKMAAEHWWLQPCWPCDAEVVRAVAALAASRRPWRLSVQWNKVWGLP